jgi:class 3 adenylate cyclase
MRDAATRLGLGLSAGLSTGEILVTNLDLGGRPQAALMGAPVDAARRLSAAALPGEILAGEPTCRLAGRAFEFARPDRDLGALKAYRAEHPRLGAGERRGERVSRLS